MSPTSVVELKPRAPDKSSPHHLLESDCTTKAHVLLKLSYYGGHHFNYTADHGSDYLTRYCNTTYSSSLLLVAWVPTCTALTYSTCQDQVTPCCNSANQYCGGFQTPQSIARCGHMHCNHGSFIPSISILVTFVVLRTSTCGFSVPSAAPINSSAIVTHGHHNHARLFSAKC